MEDKKRRFRWRQIVGCILVLFVVSSYILQKKLFPKEIRNVLLISMDTIRADHLSCYGYKRKTTPNIDAIAAEGIRCDKVISTVPLTLPAHSSMLTGTNPPYHGVHDNVGYKLSEDNLTLAEILKKQGFATGAAISAFVLDSEFKLDQGFDTYDDNFHKERIIGRVSERKGDETTKVALNWIREHKEDKFFYFLHYYDPHHDYAPPEPFRKEYANDLYAGEIAFTDYCIGRVIDKLKSLDLYDSTLIIIVGDHGEMLGEHGEMGHSYFIYQGAIKVPLVFKVPGRRKAKTIESNVGIIDIVPTVCSLLGIEHPDDLAGIDLSSFFNKGQPPANRGLYCESMLPTTYKANSLLGIVEGRYKYIQTTRPELYDLEKDPKENINLVDAQPQRARILQDKLSQILKEQTRKNNSDAGVNLDAEAIKRLESLGYVSSGVTEDFSFDKNKDDPKDVLSFHVRYGQDVPRLFVQGKFDEAEKLLKKLAVQRPDFSGTHTLLADMARERKDFNSTASHLAEAIRIEPNNASYHNDLAVMFMRLERMDEAEEYFQKALSLGSDYPVTVRNLARISLQRGQIDKSIEYGKKTIELDSSQADDYYYLGMALGMKGDFEEAIASYRKALEIEPDGVRSMNAIADILYKQGKLADAVRYYEAVLKLKPKMPSAHRNLADIYMTLGNFAKAVEHWKYALAINPGRVDVLNNMAWMLAVYNKASFHDPNEAVRLAQRACELTEYKVPELLDTLSVACAAAGKFTQAVETAEKAIGLDEAAEKKKLADGIRKRLKLFKASKAYYENR